MLSWLRQKLAAAGQAVADFAIGFAVGLAIFALLPGFIRTLFDGTLFILLTQTA
jgi:hypothetical protein